ncbi:MAG: hypothetical protein FWD02_05385 [Bacteroidales bacterium]|nr:hypothetical protein [Bacteroidales bacterium]
METYVNEPTGAGMILLLSLTGVVILYLLFRRYRSKLPNAKRDEAPAIPRNVMAATEELAAIAAVIHLYQGELRDEENTIMTINKIARAYSPWSSKIHFQNQYFNLRRR